MVDVPDHKYCSIRVRLASLHIDIERPGFLCFSKLFGISGPFREDRNTTFSQMPVRMGQKLGKWRKRAGGNNIRLQQAKRFDACAVHCYRERERLRSLAKERRFAQIGFNKRHAQIGLQLSG